jgi:hypothetical protein
MPEVENWAKYGFPDDIIFRTSYLPAVGLCKAFNERLNAEGFQRPNTFKPPAVEIPEYFTPYQGMGFTMSIDVGQVALCKYIDPGKISTAQNYRDCFWDVADLLQAAAGDEDISELNNINRPEFSAKWAIWMYNAINLLRYVPTTSWMDWPAFSYADRYDTFNFKEVSV